MDSLINVVVQNPGVQGIGIQNPGAQGLVYVRSYEGPPAAGNQSDRERFTQVFHGFAVGDVLGRTTASWYRVEPNVKGRLGKFLVVGVPDANTFEIAAAYRVYQGIPVINPVPNLTVYVSQLGRLTTDYPASGDTILRIGYMLTADKLLYCAEQTQEVA